jgi:hypothetical protein
VPERLDARRASWMLERHMTSRERSLHGATIGVMCRTYEAADLIRESIRSCGGHAIVINQFGPQRNATMPVATDALVIDISHSGCDQAITTAAALGVSVVAFALGHPTKAMTARLKVSNIRLVVEPRLDTLCDALISTLERTASAVIRKRA